ncbi:3'-5' exonuclease [Prosthecomicrobium hirschii]|uniref:DNA polymerase III subunit epsilon n=1 Tax=Prosthecodimorpha hirschii TaxID=665126 RepID=A0A0P6VLH4_9HYPH|nr:3'-5' exonuclease [Prosthecomicrobium hirschii]KPL52844.1 DNA polymerase III subunit epsilon [Prosthecomicrobium hirschii]MCW1841795.1 3'-5' exonuclease [Prosthecomicrobium hirschii]TPQ52923.1 DNA polymerase III subunit epsilon [Prosthecomicrobium hirschii]
MALLGAVTKLIDQQRLWDKRWLWMFEPDATGEVVSVDCETTGFDTRRDDVVSIAAVRIRGNRILTSEAFRAVIRPEAAMTAEAMKVHRILGSDVVDARVIREVLPEFLDFVGTRPLVGYWIDYDATMLNRYTIEYYGLRLPNRRIEVSKLYYDRKYGKAPQGSEIDLRFATILADLGLPDRVQHDAFEDALAAAEMYVVLKDMIARDVRLGRDRPGAGGPVGV